MRWLWRLIGLVSILALTWLGLGASGLLPRITPEQQAALALLRQPDPPLPGRNVSLVSWLISRNVPESDWPRYEAMPPVEAQAALQSLPAAEATEGERIAACQSGGIDCLNQVRADPEAARAERDRASPRLALIRRLQREPAHAGLIGPWDFASALPPYGSLHAPERLDAALRHLDGDTEGALASLCAHAQWWRGLRRNTDSLILTMVGAAHLGGAANSFAEIVGEMPADAPMPDACLSAFAPLEDVELDTCRVIRTEFRGIGNTMQQLKDGNADLEPSFYERITTPLLLRVEPSLALAARPLAKHCDASQHERIAARADMPASIGDACRVDGWMFNPLGCILVPIGAAPGYDQYYHRLLDLDGRLRLVASALWLRGRASPDLDATFATRPEALRDLRHRLTGTPCAPRLAHDARKPVRADQPDWDFPLPRPAHCSVSSSTETP